MTVFLTKVYRFDSPCGPLQFSKNGWRENAREKLSPGDLVVSVGTVGTETREADRGRILGLMEPTNIPVHSLDYSLAALKSDYDQDGNYRWPFALELKRAWIFREPRALLDDIISRRFTMEAAMGIVPLRQDEAEAILRLPHDEAPLAQTSLTEARIFGIETARRRSAPPPTTKRNGVMHMRSHLAYTYAMKIENASTEAIKVGWAFNLVQREQQFNQAAMPGLGGLRYRISLFQLWQTAMEAFLMEQALLRIFDRRRHAQNREILTGIEPEEFQSAWVECILARRR